MRISIIKNKGKSRKIPLWTIAFWIMIWQIASVIIGQEILLVSPFSVIKCLGTLIIKVDFWQSIMFSAGRIALGFLFAVILGVLFAILSHNFIKIRELLALPIAVIKATPVASFIILILIWIPSRNLSVFIAFLMAIPIVYINVLTGIENIDNKLVEMAKVFDVPIRKRVRYIYISQISSYFYSACALSLGMSWKAGVAAEIIGIPKGSIGERLYQSKIYLNTPELFAWTVVIITVSITFEKLFLFCINKVVKKMEG